MSVRIVHDNVHSVLLPRIPSRGLDAIPLATVSVQPLKDMGNGQDRALLACSGSPSSRKLIRPPSSRSAPDEKGTRESEMR
jgi:hypothetical protein